MFVSILMLFAAASGGPTQPAFEAALAENAAFRREQFIAAGLMPIEEAAQKGRDVRRLRTSVWLPGNPPVMEIERHRDGTVTLLLAWRGKPAERHGLAPSIWPQLTALDDAVFARPTYDRARIGKRPEGSASCHGDTAYFEAAANGQVRTAGAAQCYPRLESFDADKLTVIALFARSAVATRPECAMDESKPADALALCFR